MESNKPFVTGKQSCYSVEQQCNTSSTGSDSESTDEEERLRMLFNHCDRDGDGYIDSRDLRTMCQHLNMADTADEIIQQLGLDAKMLLSFQEFMTCREQLMKEIEQEKLRVEALPVLTWTSDSDHTASSFADADAREDFHIPEVPSLQSVLEHQNPEYLHRILREKYGKDFLDHLNSLHLSTVSRLQEELVICNNRLHHCRSEKDQITTHFTRLKTDYLRQQQSLGDRLQEQTSRYEERITELHCVIAELRRKLASQSFTSIREEEEEDREEQKSLEVPDKSFSLDENLSDDNVNQSSSDWEVEMKRAIAAIDRNLQDGFRLNHGPLRHSSPLNTQVRSSPARNIPIDPEIQALRYELCNQQEELRIKQDELYELHSKLQAVQAENNDLHQRVNDHQQLDSSLVSGQPPHRPHAPSRPSTLDLSNCGGQVSKMAERRRLKTLVEKPVLGAELSASGVPSTKVAEHIVQSYRLDCPPHPSRYPQQMATKVRELEIESDRLQSKVDRYRAENDLLQMSLSESRALNDRLMTLVGQYESNVTAMSLTLGISDQLLEAVETYAAVLQAQLVHLGATHKIHTPGSAATDSGMDDDGDDPVDTVQHSALHRRQTESSARLLLRRLESRTDSVLSPWEEMSLTSQTTSTTSSTSSVGEGEWNREDEQRIKALIGRLKTERNTVRSTILELQSAFADLLPDTEVIPLGEGELKRMDLENAVLIQELMVLKEEKADLKAQNYLLNKEKYALELQVAGKESQEQAYIVHIEHLQSEVSEWRHKLNKEDQGAFSLGPTPAITLAELRARGLDSQLAQDLTAALKREEDLRRRVTELVATLDRLSKNAETRHKQSSEFVHDLKAANSALIAAFDKAKKKYQSKIQHLQEQLKQATNPQTSRLSELTTGYTNMQ